MAIQVPDREAASRGGHKSVEVRRARVIQRAQRRALVDDLTAGMEAGSFGQEALEAALRGAETLRDALDRLPVDDYLDATRAAQVTDTLFKLYRLATGQSTSNTLSGTVDSAVLTARLDEARARLAALTADTDE